MEFGETLRNLIAGEVPCVNPGGVFRSSLIDCAVGYVLSSFRDAYQRERNINTTYAIGYACNSLLLLSNLWS